jgi:hypothetical protein
VLLHPADFTFWRPDLHLILKPLQNIQSFAKGDRRDGFADLRRRAPDRDLLAAGISNFDWRRSVMKTNVKPHDNNQGHARAEQNFSDQERTPQGSGMLLAMNVAARRVLM